MWHRLSVCALVMLTACGTIAEGTTQSLAIETSGVTGAECELSSPAIGKKTVVTPATLQLEKSQHNISVTCRKRCYRDGVGEIAPYTEEAPPKNITINGFITFRVDSAAEATNKYPDRTSILMLPIKGCRA